MANSPYERARYYSSADYKAALANKLPGEKQHTHKFHIGDAVAIGPDPESTSTYLPCYEDGCTAELHPTYNEKPGEPALEVRHEGTVKPFKGQVEGI
jgi:hypothetical protein